MCKYLLLLCFSFIASSVMGQTDTLSKEDKRLLDSMFKNDEFIKLMKQDKNYLDVAIGITNGAFSTTNNAANATGVDKQLIYIPSLVYRLKNGLSFGLSGFITADSADKPEFYQAGLMAGYDYYGKTIEAGGSYTRYLSNQNKYNSKSLYQNDLFAYVKMAKGMFQPGISVGYVTGNYKELIYRTRDTIIRILNPPPGRDTLVTRVFKDSIDNKTSYFSISASVGHDFTFYKLFSKNDELDFTPALILNMGSDKLTQTHTNRIFNSRALSRRKKTDYSNKFQMQSVAASAQLTYMYKKFFIDTNLYADYYLPETTENRLSFVFSLTAGFSF
jgi:hypothetical protein